MSASDEAVKLLPCPFCGGDEINVLSDDDERIWVQCDGCYAQIWAFVGTEAIAAWNTRPTPAPDLREVLIEQCAQIAEAYAVCGCNGSQGTCLIDDTPKAIAEEIRALSASPVGEGWQPIETAPKDGRSVLAIWQYDPDDPAKGSETHEVVRWCGWWDANGFTRPEPTHWQPLPDPPAMQSGKQGG